MKSHDFSSQQLGWVGVKERLFRLVLKVFGVFAVLLIVSILLTLVAKSILSISRLGFGFFGGTTWDPVHEIYGAFPFFVGTLLTSVLALMLAIPTAIAIALFLSEYVRGGFWSASLQTALDLLAGIPSVIYGFWGLFVLVPIVQSMQLTLGIPPYGVGIFTAALILALMITPYAASISREVMALVPQDLKEAALSLGATPFEMIWTVVIPSARSGIFAGFLMAFGRAISETMAVTMVVGNANSMPTSIFSPSNTLASVIANEFAEAVEPLYLSSLVELGLVLLVVTTVVSLLGRIIIRKLNYG